MDAVDPMIATAEPLHSSRKSRLRRKGGGAGAAPAWSATLLMDLFSIQTRGILSKAARDTRHDGWATGPHGDASVPRGGGPAQGRTRRMGRTHRADDSAGCSLPCREPCADPDRYDRKPFSPVHAGLGRVPNVRADASSSDDGRPRGLRGGPAGRRPAGDPRPTA
ncbi:protein of unknown function [Streptomyces sp. KY75]|nr:protein of unknown function [Streptomyces sp. KY70]CAD5992180.1 protein of unknown function [Streptomyces sp. KY75]